MALDRIELDGGFGDDDDAGTTAGGRELAEVAEGQDAVGEVGFVVFGKEDVEGGLDGAVLVDVVEDNDLRRDLGLKQAADPFDPVLAHSHGEFGKFGGHHGRLVAQTRGAVAAVVEEEATGVATVAPAEESGLVAGGQEAQEVFDMRRFARAAGTEVANPDGGDSGSLLTLDAQGIEKVAEPYSHGIPNGQGKENAGYCFSKRHIFN